MARIESIRADQDTLLRQIIGYAIASAAALGADAGLLYMLTRYAHWPYLPASACSFTAGAFVAYALSVKLAFHSHRLRDRRLEFLSFVALGLIGLAVNSLAMFIAVAKLGLMLLPAKALAAGCTFGTNFVLRRQLLFRPASQGECRLMSRIAIIAGAGPAGLTAALELLRHSDIKPIVFELDSQVGGISKTVNYKGNRMDLGGHRFFSKSDWVMNWWQTILPVENTPAAAGAHLAYQGASREFSASTQAASGTDDVMLVRGRLSRIFYRRKFFDYPLKLSAATLGNLGLAYTATIGAGYLRSRLFPRRPEKTLEDFLVNRFGDTLYRTFFKDYTEKVWGVPCSEISAEWGAQRIKGLSITRAVLHALKRPFQSTDTAQKGTETSLIERFLYPKHGPGQMWERVADQITAAGGNVHLRHRVIGLHRDGQNITAVDIRSEQTGEIQHLSCDFFISTMPVKDLVSLLGPEDPEVLSTASQLPYRDFMTAGLLVKRMRGGHRDSATNGMPPDNWIYIQEPDVKLGRLQVFNNWSPALVADPDTIWLGLEYFCDEGDELWRMPDAAFLDFAAGELSKIGLITREDVLDGTVVRVPKAYPAYFGAYSGIGKVRDWLDSFPNLFPVGRNGMHRYNNQDHSMLAAKAAVDNIISGSMDKSSLWSVNAEDEYHETRQS